MMGVVMNNLKYNDLKNIWDGENNLIGKPIFIDFYGDWWGPCKIFEQVLNEVTPEYKDKINFYKVNIEEESQLSTIFEVRHIPHYVMISIDGGVSPGSGATNKETLKYFLEGLISKK